MNIGQITKKISNFIASNYRIYAGKSDSNQDYYIDMAEYTAYLSTVSAGDTSQAYSTTISFDANYGSFNENAHTQSGSITFSISWTGAVFGKSTSRTIVSNGDNIIIPDGAESIMAQGASGVLIGHTFTPEEDQRYRIVFECSDVSNQTFNVIILDADEASDIVQLNAPVLSSLVPITSTVIEVYYTDTNTSPNEVQVEIQYDTVNTFDSNPQTVIGAQDSTYVKITGLSASTEYFVRVRAIGDGVVSATSNYSSTDSDTTPSAGAIESNSPVLWFRHSAKSYFTLSGNDITAIDSIAPATVDATAPGNDPNYGASAMEFVSASSEYLNIDGIAAYLNDHDDEFTIAFVATSKTTGAFNNFFGSEYTSGSAGRYLVNVNTSDQWNFQKRNASASTINTVIGTATQDTKFIVVISHSTGELLNAYVNGSKTVTDTDVSTAAFDYVTDIGNLGRIYVAGSPSYADIEIDEIAIFGTALSDANMQAVRDYLNGIYSVY